MAKEPTYYEVPPGKIAGGKTDLVAEVNGYLAVVDWKSGKPPDPRYNPNGYPEWPLQTAAYRSGVPDVQRNMVVHLDISNGKPIVFDYSESYEQDLSAFRLLLSFWMNRNGHKLAPGKGPRVTMITGMLSKELVPWGCNCMEEYAHQHLTEDTLEKAKVYAVLKEGKGEHRRRSQESKDLGTTIHACIEQFLRSGVEPKIDDPRILAGFVAFLEWFQDNKVKVVDLERVVFI